MARKTSDGASYGDHAESARRQFEKLGKTPKRPIIAEEPEFPQLIDHLWRWFNEIIAGVPPGGFGPQVMPWSDMRAWCELTGERLEPWEARALIRLGIVRVNVLSEEVKSSGGVDANRADRGLHRGRG